MSHHSCERYGISPTFRAANMRNMAIQPRETKVANVSYRPTVDCQMPFSACDNRRSQR